MKNVFIRYMRCENENDQTKANILLNIIVTILKFNANEITQIKNRKKTWWNLY